MALLVKRKRRVVGPYGDVSTVVTYRLFGVVPVFSRSRAPRSPYGGHVLEDPVSPASPGAAD